MSFLYLISPDDGGHDTPIKIGITSNLKARIKMIQTGCHFKIRYFQAWDYTGTDYEAAQMELEAHRQLAKYRLAGEWFNLRAARIADTIDDTHRYVFVNFAGLTPLEAAALAVEMRCVGAVIDAHGRPIREMAAQ